MPCLEMSPISVTRPDLRIDVDGAEPEVERDQRAEYRRRQRDQDDQRIAEALVLGGQHQIDDDERERRR